MNCQTLSQDLKNKVWQQKIEVKKFKTTEDTFKDQKYIQGTLTKGERTVRLTSLY
jgi:hypothetical protein